MLGDLPSQILWGVGNENVIDFEYPELIDSKRTWRRPAPGSVRARNAAGTTDAAVYGYDYLLAGRARWFDAESYSNPVGLQAFIDWAGRGNQFRFVPDKNAPDFYVDGVTLDAPFEDPAPDLEEANGSQAIDLVLRNPTVDFGQALRGVMFEYAPGMSLVDPTAATFTRATAATRRGLPGNLAAAIGATDASGVLRDRHYEASLRTTLLEALRIQLVTDPENLGNWTVTGAVGRTSGQADPFGGTGAYLLDSNTPTASDAIFQAVTFTGDATKAVAVFVKSFSGASIQIAIWDNTAATFRHRVTVSFLGNGDVNNVTTADGSGTIFAVENWGNGWWRIAFSAAGVVAANANRIYLYPDSTGSGSATYTFGVNAWNATFPSSYQGPSLGTRNADVFSWPFTHKPQAMFALVELVDRGTRDTNEARYLEIGQAASAAPRLILRTTSGANTSWRHDNNSSDVEDVLAVSTHALGDRIELLGIVNPAGDVRLRKSVNGGSEIVGSGSAALPFAAAFSDTKLWLGSVSSEVGFGAFLRVKVGPLTFAGVTRDTIAKARAA